MRESQGRVSRRRRPSFLPTVDLNFLYTPAQRFPLIRIPAGIFGPNEQTFEAGFTRQNIMQLQINQPLYTGGRLERLRHPGRRRSTRPKLQLDRARQELQYRVVETFYAALMNEQGVRVADEQITFAEKQLALAKARFEAGSVARLDVLQAEVELANSKARRIQARAAVDTVVSGAAHGAVAAAVAGAGAAAAISTSGREQLTRATLDRRRFRRGPTSAPSPRGATSREHSVNLANAEWKPSLALTGNVQYQEDGLDSLLNTDNQSYTFGVALRVPLFSRPAPRRAAAWRRRRSSRPSTGSTPRPMRRSSSSSPRGRRSRRRTKS